jgi:hypothetical protein
MSIVHTKLLESDQAILIAPTKSENNLCGKEKKNYMKNRLSKKDFFKCPFQHFIGSLHFISQLEKVFFCIKIEKLELMPAIKNNGRKHK